MKRFLLNLPRNTLGISCLVVMTIVGVIVAAVTMAWSADGVGKHASHWAFQAWSRLSLRLFGVRVYVVGMENLAGPPCVMVSNHRSHIDVPVLGAVLPVPVCSVYKKSLERIPILSSALWLSQSVGVDREDSANSRQQMDLVASRLKGGRSIVVFPEGFRSTAPVLMPFKKGAVVTALEQQVDIVPITIVGTGSLYPPNQLMVMPGDVLVVIHPRESTAGLNLSDRATLNQKLRDIVSSAFSPGRPTLLRLHNAVRVL